MLQPSRHTQALYLAKLGIDIDDDWDIESGSPGREQAQAAAGPSDDVQEPLLRSASCQGSPTMRDHSEHSELVDDSQTLQGDAVALGSDTGHAETESDSSEPQQQAGLLKDNCSAG